LNGKAVAKDSTVYHCATNDFVAAGGDGYTMMGKVTQVGRMLNEVFADYLKDKYPVK
jgi:5'-nucleotidase / UDP-sugar diphosphatase